MLPMVRALALATIFVVTLRAGGPQAQSVLHIKVAILDTEQKVTPVTRHPLLISENPASASPRRILTSADGTADVRLRPGNYTIESDEPIAFQGKAYQWRQVVDIVAGRDTVLELTASNAEVEAVSVSTATSATSPVATLDTDPSFLLPKWQDSVVALWTPTTRASGFVIDARGLIVTSQRVVRTPGPPGTVTSVEVQLTPIVKVTANVLAADPVKDVAILWIDPKAIASVAPVPLGCAEAAKPSVVSGQRLVTIGAPLREQKGLRFGTVNRVTAGTILSDFILARGSLGGPVFTVGGEVFGLTTVPDEQDDRSSGRADIPLVPIHDACAVVSAAEKKMAGAEPPTGTVLPVEPAQPFPVDALREAAKRGTAAVTPYQMSSADFDVAFITPGLIYAARYGADQASGRAGGRSTSGPPDQSSLMRPLQDFGTWSDYVADAPPVLLVRVTPRLVEGFWTTVARGAARTQGVSIPPIKRFKAGFSRLRAFCGATEVTPIHPFKLEQRVSDDDAIYEGLYVFDPGALGPECGTVKLVLYSEKDPGRADTKIVDPKIVEQVWQDFVPYRALPK